MHDSNSCGEIHPGSTPGSGTTRSDRAQFSTLCIKQMIYMKDTKILSENDLEAIFAGKKRKNQNRFLLYGAYLFLTVLLFFLLFLTLNGPSVVTRVNYWYNTEYSTGTNNTDPSSNNDGASTVTTSPTNVPDIANNSIWVERINIHAPILFDISNDPEATAKALESGVIHLSGTAHPGEVGNVFVTGHSSNYIWAPGKFKSIFSLLPKVVIGDQIYINFNNKAFRYKVRNIKTVNPNDISVLEQGNESILTLVTCVPVGTSNNRLIIKADQVYPNPSANLRTNNAATNQKLPQSR